MSEQAAAAGVGDPDALAAQLVGAIATAHVTGLGPAARRAREVAQMLVDQAANAP